MRVAIWYNLPSGGAKRSLHYQVRGLRERGHRVELWRPPVPQEGYLRLSELAPEHVRPIPDFERDSRLYPRRLWLYHTRIDRIVGAMVEHARACAREIEAGGFDVLFSHTCLRFHAPFISRFVSLPKAVYLHEPKRQLYEAIPTLPWLIPEAPDQAGWSVRAIKRRGRAAADLRAWRVHLTEELRNARGFDSILVNSRFSRESVLRAYNLDAEVCYLGVDTGLFREIGLPRERFVVGLGSIIETKNVSLVLEALSRLPRRIRPPLVWVGNMWNDAYQAQMERLADRLGVEAHFRRYVSDAELVCLLNRAWAMVYAPRLEPFGFAPLEANACGTPVVAVAEGGVRETIEHARNGLLTEHDPEDLAASLALLLEDPALRERLSRQAVATVAERWSLEASNDRLEQRLRALAER